MPWIKYRSGFEKGSLWRSVLKRIDAWRDYTDIYAIDCIRLKSTAKMIGIWSPYSDNEVFQEILENNLDSYPSWSKFKPHPERQEELREQVDRKLSQIAYRYRHVIAFVNVRAYYECLESLSRKYKITILPRDISWLTPRGITNSQFDQLRLELHRRLPLPDSQ
jgi:hypothetical protein